MPAPTQTEIPATGQTLYMALALSKRKWKLGFSDGRKWRQRTLTAGDQRAVWAEIAGAKEKFGLDADVPVRSCYEAGRDGFWLPRWLCSVGIANAVVDSASIEVNRRARQVKTDRVEVEKWVGLLLRYHGGERKALSIVHVPRVPEEIDLNPVRAGLVERPEAYRWCSLAYHVQTGNKDDFLSLDFGVTGFGEWDATTRLQDYRRYLYEHGAQPARKGVGLDPQLVDTEAKKGFALTPADRLLSRTRYFTDGGVIGTKAFVARCAQLFAPHFSSRHPKLPKPIVGLAGLYALKRLSEARSATGG